MVEPTDNLITANRARRKQARKRKTVVIIVLALALLGSNVLDGVLGAPEDGGTAPFVITVMAAVRLGMLWLDARRDEGIERMILGRVGLITTIVVLAFSTGAYAAWLVADVAPSPNIYLEIASLAVLMGVVGGDIGMLRERDE